jgi:cytochrome P450
VSARADIPGPRAAPVVGPLANLVYFSRDIIGGVGALFREHGPIASVTGGDLNARPRVARWVFVHGAELNHELITNPTDYHKPPSTKHLYPRGEDLSNREKALRRWGAGLFNFYGEEHTRHRRLLMPGFHKDRIAGYVADMLAITDEELRAWRPGSVRDVRSDMAFLTLRIAARTLFGEAVTDRSERGIGGLIQRAFAMLLRPSLLLLPFDLPGLPYREFLDVVCATDDAIRRMIAAKRARGDEGDLLSALIRERDEDGSALSEEDLIGHASAMFVAGQETTSSALTWTLLLLSQHPGVAADLVDELDGVLRGAPPSTEDLGRLPMLEAVLKESMRVLPAVAINTRVVARPTELRGHPLPVGTNVAMSIYHTHRVPEVFPRPQAFDPRRWESARPTPYEYCPFSTGPRTCVGAQFAMAQLKVVLATLLQRFRVEFVPGTRVDRTLSITMSVKGALPMRIQPRDGRFRDGAHGLRGDVREMVDLPA